MRFEELEEALELRAGLEYEAYRERLLSLDDFPDEDAYELSDPKHPDHHDAMADLGDNREKYA